MTRKALFDFLATGIAKWWLPDDVLFVPELPHTATGKLLKTKLREMYGHVLPGWAASLERWMGFLLVSCRLLRVYRECPSCSGSSQRCAGPKLPLLK